ncbi:MAG: alpha/beta hydrolase [Chloroflexi bacterium]|nr:alpha/beta hydrolase [Chloroflexota bacterium]
MARRRTADLGDLRLAYSEWPGQGRPLVLLHGLASNRHIWDLVAPHLAPRFRVLAPDQRGHGESDKPDQGYDVATPAADLECFLQAAGVEQPVLVGHSWGAGVALVYAATRPEAVAALVLVDGGFADLQATDRSWEQVERELAPPQLAGMARPEFLARVRSGPLGGLWSPTVEAIVLANFQVDPQDRISPRLTRERHMQLVRALWELRPSELWPRLRCPTLLLPARRQPENEREAAFLERKAAGVAAAERLIPRAAVHWMDDTIHDIPLQRPEELARAIASLAGL